MNTESAADGASANVTDKLGVAASATCAVHCAATALAPGVLSALGLGALMGHEAEWGFTVLAAVLAASALVYGWRSHRSVPIAAAFGVGIVLLLLSRVVEEAGVHSAGTAVGVVAGMALIAAHLMNIRRS